MEVRLVKAGITDMRALWALDSRCMRQIWGEVLGDKMWRQLRGVDLAEEGTSRRSIGHSHVLAPELRDPAKAKAVARRLTLKAASRLRRMEYYAGALSLAVRIENGSRLEGSARCYRAQDSMTFLGLLDKLWESLAQQTQGACIKKVSITLYDLIPISGLQAELFDVLPDIDMCERVKAEKISQALDKINYRFGRDSVLLGMLPSEGRSFSGTKIAFTRIPDIEEFVE